MPSAAGPQPSHTHVGPPLLGLALISTALFVASLIVGAAGGGPFPSPYDDAGVIASFFAEHGTTVRVAATLQFASVVPFAILAVSLSSRLRFLGMAHVPGVLIASMGGILAAAMLATSALVQWVLSRPEVADQRAVVRPLADLAFAAGGPGAVVFLGLLVAGVAVPAMYRRLLSRPVVVAGLIVAAVAELSTIALLTESATFLLPVGRFGGLLWLIAAAALLPAQRAAPLAAPALG